MSVLRIVIAAFWISLLVPLPAQVSSNLLITAQYRGTPLSEVLRDLDRRYDLHFSYSSDVIPLQHPMHAHIDRKPLSEALNILFEDTPVKHAVIGGQVILRRNENYQQMSRLETLPRSVRQSSPVHPSGRGKTPPPAPARPPVSPVTPIDRRPTSELTHAEGSMARRELNVRPIAIAIQSAEPPPVEPNRNDDDRRLAQISLLPYLGTNTLRSTEITNQMSVNLLWGANGGVDGVEVGGLLNSVRRDVRGVQVAGLGNMVGEDVTGTQVAGIFNRVGGTTTGVQVAGLLNDNRGNNFGVQVAGLYNYTHGDTAEVQIAGLFNYAEGRVNTQLSPLFNQAGDVGWGQASLLNLGKRVGGFQLGIINFSDTIAGAPIGLLSIVRRGYNKMEISSGEYLWANLGFKFGGRRFYNIFHFGARWDDLNRVQPDGQTLNGVFMSWGLGYGFGIAPPLGRRVLLNIEAVAIHINELEAWTNQLNMLVQNRFTFDFQVGRHINLFAGPVINMMWSTLSDEQTGAKGSTLVPEPLLDRQHLDVNFKAWIGFQAGMRF